MTYTITLTEQEIQIVLECLSAQAYKHVAPVIERITAQVKEQAAPVPLRSHTARD